jgi:hypothetical protein
VILSDLTGGEDHPVYQELEISNGDRQYSFLRSIVVASLKMERPFLSQNVIKALNYHAITCLHTTPGEYRPCEVEVGKGEDAYHPPPHYRVQALMDDFVNGVNRHWIQADPVVLACFVLWRLNHIHPFINGNGRTARVTSYFVLCLKNEGWLRGDPILPELIKQNRPEYVAALKAVDRSVVAGELALGPLHTLVTRLLAEQIRAAGDPPPPNEDGGDS